MCVKVPAAPPACKEVAVAATDVWRRLAGLLGGLLAATSARAVDLPEDRAEAMIHVYDGGGTRASGPAVLVRKKVADRISLNATYYVDMVSNASIDVVTTASPYRETRTEVGGGLDYAYRDALLTLSASSSREPDYVANRVNFDVAHEVFGGMTTVALGYTRGADQVGKHDTVGFFDRATHWQYRLGVTQILSPRWLLSANLEAMSDDGYLGNPYRAARVFGAAVPERDPRTRTSRAAKLRVIGDIGTGSSVRAEYRYFWDTWAIKAHTLEVGASRHLAPGWLADAQLRYYTQRHALFYSDNASTETLYVSRNRQLSSFHSTSLGAKLAYTFKQVPTQYELKLNGAYQWMRYQHSDFTDIRTGKPYRYDANVLQLFVSATF